MNIFRKLLLMFFGRAGGSGKSSVSDGKTITFSIGGGGLSTKATATPSKCILKQNKELRKYPWSIK